jgi:hypothetical protein
MLYEYHVKVTLAVRCSLDNHDVFRAARAGNSAIGSTIAHAIPYLPTCEKERAKLGDLISEKLQKVICKQSASG